MRPDTPEVIRDRGRTLAGSGHRGRKYLSVVCRRLGGSREREEGRRYPKVLLESTFHPVNSGVTSTADRTIPQPWVGLYLRTTPLMTLL